MLFFLQKFSSLIVFTLIFLIKWQWVSLQPGHVLSIFLENLFNEETVGFLAILKVLIEFLLEIAKLWNL